MKEHVGNQELKFIALEKAWQLPYKMDCSLHCLYALFLQKIHI